MSVVPGVTLLIRAALAAVLLSVGASKLANTKSFAILLVSLGVPVRQKLLLHLLAWVSPLLAVALGLVMVSGLWPTASNGLLLVLIGSFSVVVCITLCKKTQESHSGSASTSQLSSKDLARGVFLTVLAAVNLWGGTAYASQVNRLPGVIMLLVALLLLSTAAATRMAKTIASFKDELPLKASGSSSLQQLVMFDTIGQDTSFRHQQDRRWPQVAHKFNIVRYGDNCASVGTKRLANKVP